MIQVLEIASTGEHGVRIDGIITEQETIITNIAEDHF